MAKAIVHFFPLNEEEEDEQKNVEENKQLEEKDKIGSTMRSSVTMLRSCTHRPKQFFLFSKQGKGEEITTTIQSSAAIQQTYTCRKANCFFPVNKEEEEIGR